MPEDIRSAFRAYIADELDVDPDTPIAQHDAAYAARYEKWKLESHSLTLSKYVRADVEARDPHSAVDLFRTQYRRLKSVVYITRKSTGTSSEKSVHYTHRNVGRSPVQLQDVSVVCGPPVSADHASDLVIAHLDAPSFPYQKLKNEFPRQRELTALFFDKCPVFRQLSVSYANALEAYANRDVDDIVRNLAVATELVFASDHFDEIATKKLLLNEGAMLLALDWLREQFQSLTFLTKHRSPALSEERETLQIHLQILDDDLWPNYAARVSAPALLRWRRDRLMAVVGSPGPGLEALKTRFKAELTILWHARHQYAHRANVFREGYFVALLLNLFRISLDYRFSCYAIWVEWHAGRVIEGGPSGPDWAVYKDAFADGWKKEFAKRVASIPSDFEMIKANAGAMVKRLVLGAGYVGLGIHPRRTTPERPVSL